MPITKACEEKRVKFSKTYQPNKHTGPRLTTILSKLLATKLDSSDAQVEAALKASKVKKTKEAGLALRYIFNGLEGDTKAIEGIFDRVDGKVAQKNINENIGEIKIMGTIKVNSTPLEVKIGD